MNSSLQFHYRYLQTAALCHISLKNYCSFCNSNKSKETIYFKLYKISNANMNFGSGLLLHNFLHMVILSLQSYFSFMQPRLCYLSGLSYFSVCNNCKLSMFVICGKVRGSLNKNIFLTQFILQVSSSAARFKGVKAESCGQEKQENIHCTG